MRPSGSRTDGGDASAVLSIMVRIVLCSAIATFAVTGCGGEPAGKSQGAASRDPGPQPDELPALLTSELPFRYPESLYARKVQGNVTLRLYIDRDGRVMADSTRVEESSGYSALDSAAVRGSQELYFIPAKLHGEPMAVRVLFPVYFRHPEAAPLPGDTILAKHSADTGRS